MTYLWELFSQGALVFAVIYGVYLCFGLVRWAWSDPRGFGSRLKGEVALAVAGVAVLVAVVIGERQGWW